MKNASTNQHVTVLNPTGRSSVVIVCEHASRVIPAPFDNLGLSGRALESHAAWDPGAMSVAQTMSKLLDAPLVASNVSRLVYDCNRPPTAPDAMPAKSEVFDVPGNVNLTAAQRQSRADMYYEPFRAHLAEVIATKSAPVIVTMHSFTPVYHGRTRDVEIGLLHDSDSRLADVMLDIAATHTDHTVLRNAPYGPEHGVTHTLKEHAIGAGHLNVMLEVRNDLLQSQTDQNAMAQIIAEWLNAALPTLRSAEVA